MRCERARQPPDPADNQGADVPPLVGFSTKHSWHLFWLCSPEETGVLKHLGIAGLADEGIANLCQYVFDNFLQPNP